MFPSLPAVEVKNASPLRMPVLSAREGKSAVTDDNRVDNA